MKQGLRLAACLCVLAAMLPAMATVESHVEVDLPQIVLVDLDPHDGIPATWMSGGYVAPDFHFALRPAPVFDEVYGDGRLLLDGAPTRIGGRAFAADSGYLAVTDLYMPGFTLTVTPYTRVSVQVPYRLELQIEPAAGELRNVLASVELSLLALNGLRIDADSGEARYALLPYQRDFASLQALGAPWPSGPQAQDGVLSVSFDNDSAGDAIFAFRAELVAFGNTGSVAAVPEPATLGLWLLGAGAIGWRLRRARVADGGA